MPDTHYMNPKLAEIYDEENSWSDDNDFYLSISGNTPINILDLGCGTGVICNAYIDQGHKVTGIDPASSMLEVASKKPNGKKIEWVKSNAQSFRSDDKFDLVIMTGHAFQVLLCEQDLLATFENISH